MGSDRLGSSLHTRQPRRSTRAILACRRQVRSFDASDRLNVAPWSRIGRCIRARGATVGVLCKNWESALMERTMGDLDRENDTTDLRDASQGRHSAPQHPPSPDA